MDASLGRSEGDVPAAGDLFRPALLLPGVRRWIWVAFVLALANGVFLYFLPGQAEAHYAWAIKPPINAAFLGAGYLSGVLATAIALFVVRYWRSVWSLMWPFFTIGLVMLLATIVHADRFRWHYPLTWVWAVVYVLIPPGALALWIWQTRSGDADPPLDHRLVILKGFSWCFGAITAIIGLALFLTPERMVAHWPWAITPLLARAFAAWYLQIAVALLFSAAKLRQAHEVVVPYSWLTFFNLLLLLLPMLYSDNVHVHQASFGPWLVLHLALFAGCGAATLQAWRLMRVMGQQL